MLTPELVEREVEHGQLLGAMNEQRAAGVEHLVAHPEVHVTQGFDDIDHPPRVDVDPDAPKEPAEEKEVIEEARHCVTTTFATKDTKDTKAT